MRGLGWAGQHRQSQPHLQGNAAGGSHFLWTLPSHSPTTAAWGSLRSTGSNGAVGKALVLCPQEMPLPVPKSPRSSCPHAGPCPWGGGIGSAHLGSTDHEPCPALLTSASSSSCCVAASRSLRILSFQGTGQSQSSIQAAQAKREGELSAQAARAGTGAETPMHKLGQQQEEAAGQSRAMGKLGCPCGMGCRNADAVQPGRAREWSPAQAAQPRSGMTPFCPTPPHLLASLVLGKAC